MVCSLQGKGVSRDFQGFPKISPKRFLSMEMLPLPLFPSPREEVQLSSTSEASLGDNTAVSQLHTPFLGERKKF